MVRLASVALLVAIAETPAWSQSIGSASPPLSLDAWRINENGGPKSPFSLPHNLEDSMASAPKSHIIASMEVSANSALGLGMFGPTRDRAGLPPVTVYTVYEVNTRPSRKSGLGFSLKF
jgi:hypothetical protein